MSGLLICNISATDYSFAEGNAETYNITREAANDIFVYIEDADDYLIKSTNFEDS